MNKIVKQLCPPVLLGGARKIRNALSGTAPVTRSSQTQDLDVYWDPKMADMLESWGEGNAWNDIQLLMAHRSGKVLDIACGTGKVIEILKRFPAIELHGCDISDLLLSRAAQRGIAPDRLTLTDATKMIYPNKSFDFAYSIGSLEHFTEDGILAFMRENLRIVNGPTFHMVPMSRDGKDHGWITTSQSYFNNSESWWLKKCLQIYPKATLLASSWSDGISIGRWMMCSPQMQQDIGV